MLYKYDAYRCCGNVNTIYLFKLFVSMPGCRFLFWFRLAQSIKNPILGGLIRKIILRHYMVKYGFQIPYSTKVGRGLYLGHWGNVIINPKVTVGDNCNIAQGVTIGQENRGKRKGVPTIGNKVWIGAISVIVGNITVGDNVLIAPLTFVNVDIPSNSIVVGNPCKIIGSDNAVEGYINRTV